MTSNSPNENNRPPQQSGYNPLTFEDLQRSLHSSDHGLFDDLANPASRWRSAPIFLFIFFYTLRLPFVAPLTILVLLGCLLTRMETHSRQIAAVPLTLSAIKLSFQMSSQMTEALFYPGPVRSLGTDPGFIWLPMFFSICLIFIPKRESATFKIIVAASCLMLASGLLPGQGYLCIFYLLEYLLFVAIVIGIFVDLKSHIPSQIQGSLRPAQ
ncbi:MAG TPA: hypothetical protein VKP61_16995 [Candidatus Acidoferrum sp.]|nr:hypothetical protein [Candidatus Acidoferrum sp.]